jgi:hypothetical protein
VANTTVVYENPATLDNCAQYTQRTVFALQQLWPTSDVRQTGNETFAIGNLTQLIGVVDAATNASRMYNIVWSDTSVDSTSESAVARVLLPESVA